MPSAENHGPCSEPGSTSVAPSPGLSSAQRDFARVVGKLLAAQWRAAHRAADSVSAERDDKMQPVDGASDRTAD